MLQDFFLCRRFHGPEIELAVLSRDLVGAEKVDPRSVDLEDLRARAGLGENMGVTELAYATDEVRNTIRSALHVFEKKGTRTFEAAQRATEYTRSGVVLFFLRIVRHERKRVEHGVGAPHVDIAEDERAVCAFHLLGVHVAADAAADGKRQK